MICNAGFVRFQNLYARESCRDRRQRKPDGKRAALAFAGACRMNASTVSLNEFADYGQSQSDSHSGFRTFGLHEPIEYMRQKLGSNPTARIVDLNFGG
jgi:hypothetical protein